MKIETTNSLNFSKKRINNEDFRGVCLKEATFDHSVLIGCDFRGCDLEGARFYEATLIDCNFEDADLSLVNLNCSFMQNCNFKTANLADTAFQSVTMKQCNFQGALIDNKYKLMYECKIHECDFRNSKLSIGITKGEIKSCDFRSIKIGFKIFVISDSSIDKCDFSGYGKDCNDEKKRGLDFQNNSFYECNFSNSKFNSELFCKSKFDFCDLSNSKFKGTRFDECSFHQIDFTNSSFRVCYFNKFSFFWKTKMENTKFEYCDLSEGSAYKKHLNKSSFIEVDLSSAEFIYCTFSKCDKFNDVNFKRTRLEHCNFDDVPKKGRRLSDARIYKEMEHSKIAGLIHVQKWK